MRTHRPNGERWIRKPWAITAVVTAVAAVAMLGARTPPARAMLTCPIEMPVSVHTATTPGVSASTSPDPKFVSCGSLTQSYTGETSIGATSDGTVWFSGAEWEWKLARTDDLGGHWNTVAANVPQARPGCYFGLSDVTGCDTSESSKNNTVADSYLYVDPRTSKIFWSKTWPLAMCSSLTMSADDGRTWTGLKQHLCPAGDYDKVGAGPPPPNGAKPSGYPDVVYACANGPAPTFLVGPARLCFRSLDGGTSWSPAGAPTPSPLAPGCGWFQEAPRVGPDGAVYQPLNCRLMGTNPAGLVQLAVSDDEATTWSYRIVPTGSVGLGASLIGGVSADVDAAGTVYIVWPGEDHGVYLATSKDKGKTFSGPVLVSVPGISQAAGPYAQVAADVKKPGHVAVAYYGTSPTAPAGTMDGYLGESFDAGRTWHTAKVSSSPLWFPVASGSLPRNDYLGVTIAPDGTPWAAFIKLLSSTPDKEGFIQSTGYAVRLARH